MSDVATASATDLAREACTRILGCLAQGAPWDACDVFRDAIAGNPGDPDLLYCGALAHARSGAAAEAHALLDRAQAAPDAAARLSDILSLRGRLWKDALHCAPAGADATRIAHEAREQYLAAWNLGHDPFPGINAATLSILAGEPDAARALAQEVFARVGARGAAPDAWDHATAGEALLLLGRVDDARRSYASAVAAAAGDAGSVATMRRQLRLLARVEPEAAAIVALLPTPAVVAFAGHMIDSPGRTPPRFPPELAPAVEAALRERLAQLRQPVVFTSAACGADLLCIEAALALGAEVNVVLPFDRDDFVRTSVAVAGDSWVRRFDDALARVARVIPATTESHLGDDVLYEHAALLVEGLAVLRAAQLETSPAMLCVLDSDAGGRTGGTRASFDRWRRTIGDPQVIDLARLRAHAAAPASRASPEDRAAPPAHVGGPVADAAASSPQEPRAPEAPAHAAAPVNRPQRTLKSLLFADFAGYSRLHDAYAPLFQGRFWAIAAAELEASSFKPLLANTWGDALYIVFDAPRDGAEFALGLLARMRAEDWTAAGLPATSQIRIALHAGPVFCGLDPIIGRDNFFGSSVTRAARIEPVTPPGTVYTSEAFAATLAATGARDYALEYVGRLALAKGYGESRIYRLERR